MNRVWIAQRWLRRAVNRLPDGWCRDAAHDALDSVRHWLREGGPAAGQACRRAAQSLEAVARHGDAMSRPYRQWAESGATGSEAAAAEGAADAIVALFHTLNRVAALARAVAAAEAGDRAGARDELARAGFPE